jgi:hypothetical protein
MDQDLQDGDLGRTGRYFADVRKTLDRDTVVMR